MSSFSTWVKALISRTWSSVMAAGTKSGGPPSRFEWEPS